MKKVMIILFVTTCLYSCTSDDTNETQEANNFYALTVGNSWEYKYYLRDMATNDFVVTPVTETIEITHTVTIDSNTFYNFKYTVDGNNTNQNLLPANGERNFMFRDSLGYLIDQHGGIKYASNNYEEHFIDHYTADRSYYLKLAEAQATITTNAGTFSCADNQYYIKDINGTLSNSRDHIYRKDGEGEILGTMSFSSQSQHFAEKRLESYTVQ